MGDTSPTPHAARELIATVRARLAAEGDREYALGQQRYMKSDMPYFGVRMPRVQAIGRETFKAHALTSYEVWHDTVLALFREAAHREEWYAAVELALRPAYREYARRLEALALYETLIVEAAWWDIVDIVASKLVGGLYETDEPWTAARMREWSTDAVMWKRRTAILSQLRRGEDVDLPLLYDCIAPNLGDREFFIRKAIGWALRQVAWDQPDEVVRYVEAHRDELSGLSKREALKNVLKSGRIKAIP